MYVSMAQNKKTMKDLVFNSFSASIPRICFHDVFVPAEGGGVRGNV